MGTDATTDAMLRHIIDAALRGELDEQDAARIYELGPEATTAFVMAISARIADQEARIAELCALAINHPTSGAHTPSGAIPPYAKPATSKRRRGKPGARRSSRFSSRRPRR